MTFDKKPEIAPWRTWQETGFWVQKNTYFLSVPPPRLCPCASSCSNLKPVLLALCGLPFLEPWTGTVQLAPQPSILSLSYSVVEAILPISRPSSIWGHPLPSFLSGSDHYSLVFIEFQCLEWAVTFTVTETGLSLQAVRLQWTEAQGCLHP